MRYHRVGLTAAQSAELWERWKKGEGRDDPLSAPPKNGHSGRPHRAVRSVRTNTDHCRAACRRLSTRPVREMLCSARLWRPAAEYGGLHPNEIDR